MRFKEFHYILSESRGLGARRPGEEFVSITNPDDRLYLSVIQFYPNNASGFNSVEDLNAALQEVEETLKSATVNIVGKFKSSDRAFGLAVFSRDGGEVIAFIKPFKQVNQDPTQNSWSNQTGIPGYRYNSKAAAKTQQGLTPQDILSELNDLSVDDIINQLSNSDKFGEDHPLTQVAKQVAAGTKLPISLPIPDNISFTAFRDYFCEVLHPIALHRGIYTGNAGEAADKFLGAGGFAATSINFGANKTEGLSDSILISAEGKQIKVSSKGGKGAEASVKNLLDAIKELNDSTIIKKHSKIVDLILETVKLGQASAPLVLGAKYGIIEESDIEKIKSLKGDGTRTIEDFKSLDISNKLKKLVATRATKTPDNLNLYFHSIAAVAHQVADYINEKTNFSKAASEILNNGALVQVYTNATEGKDSWTIKSFNTVWPSNTVTGVKFSAQKNYSSGSIKGNFTFKILLNGVNDIPDEHSQLDKTIAADKKTPAKFGPAAIGSGENPSTDVSTPSRKKR